MSGELCGSESPASVTVDDSVTSSASGARVHLPIGSDCSEGSSVVVKRFRKRPLPEHDPPEESLLLDHAASPQDSEVSANFGSARSASQLSPLVPAFIPSRIFQGAPVVSSEKLSGIGVRPRLTSCASGPKVVTSASAHSANWKRVFGIWSELVSRHTTCSPHFAGALDSERKEVPLSQMLSRMADMTLLRYLRSVMLFFDMRDTVRLHLSDLHQANVMDVPLCLQEASRRPLDRLPADAFLTCVWASLRQHDSRDTWWTAQPLGGASSGIVCASAD